MKNTVNHIPVFFKFLRPYEFQAICFNNPGTVVTTGRSNKVVTTFAIQDYSRLGKEYGHDQTEEIRNISGNLTNGQVTRDTATQLAGHFGKLL